MYDTDRKISKKFMTIHMGESKLRKHNKKLINLNLPLQVLCILERCSSTIKKKEPLKVLKFFSLKSTDILHVFE